MISFFDVENLDKFLKNFYVAVGIRISVFDDEFRLVTEYPKNAPEFCSLIRTKEVGREGCKNCDIAAFKLARKTHTTHVYTCHAGLTEAVSPIKIGEGIMGYAILAHMLPKENYRQSLENALQRATDYGLNPNEALAALKKIPTHSNEKIEACVQILNAVASYLQIADYVKWKTEDCARKITEYIELNLNGELNSNVLCKKFLLSRTKLYQIAMESFGMSITRYITYKRIEAAKRLLLNNESIANVAKKTGFPDPNYFSKVFKKEVGVSPTLYKKSN